MSFEISHRKPSKTHFFILFDGRAGSSQIITCLNSHPNVICYPEILADQDQSGQKTTLDALVSGLPIEESNPYATDMRYHHVPLDQKQHLETIGFKTKLYHIIDTSRFNTLVKNNAFKFVSLRRKNVIKSVLSALNAQRISQKYGQFNISDNTQKQGPLFVSPKHFADELKKRLNIEIAHEQYYNESELDKQIFYYEDLLEDPNQFYKNLLSFLDVQYLPLKGKFVKHTSDRLSEAIENYTQIYDMFAGTHFEPFFAE